MVTASILMFLGILCSNQVAAFLTPSSSMVVRERATTVSISCKSSTESDGIKATSRRSFVEDTLKSCSLGISLAVLSASPPPVYASGGATAVSKDSRSSCSSYVHKLHSLLLVHRVVLTY